MTTAERKANELATLIAEHRVVRVSMQAEHATVTARVAMPEYGIAAGETYHLVAASSYKGYAYIVRWDSAWTRHACSCVGCEMRHTCKHTVLVNEICIERSHKPAPLTPEQYDDMSDLIDETPEQHAAYRAQLVEQESGNVDIFKQEREAWRAMSPEQRREAYCNIFAIYSDVA